MIILLALSVEEDGDVSAIIRMTAIMMDSPALFLPSLKSTILPNIIANRYEGTFSADMAAIFTGTYVLPTRLTCPNKENSFRPAIG
jgi:hypothetical protein